MLHFKKWLQEDAGEVVGTYYNDELLQSRVRSKSLATVNKPDLSGDRAKCKFLGICDNKKAKDKVNKFVPEEL
jgi:hypothetical protein